MAIRRYILYKSSPKRTYSQKERGQLIFDLYSDIMTVYNLNQQLRGIYNSILPCLNWRISIET
nr:hypothetical protein [Flavobacterium aquariorum]